MAFDISATVLGVQGFLEDSGLYFKAAVARPGRPPGNGPWATIGIESMQVVAVTSHPIELHVLTVRIWMAKNKQGEEARELDIAEIVSQTLDLIYGDFTLGGLVRNVDVAGQYGSPLAAEFVDAEVARAQYHVADITLPLIVDRATVLVA